MFPSSFIIESSSDDSGRRYTSLDVGAVNNLARLESSLCLSWDSVSVLCRILFSLK